MKTWIVKKSNQYSEVETVSGSRKKCLRYLREEAQAMRRSARELRNLPLSIFPIPEKDHPSRIVTLGSFQINQMPAGDLLTAMNAHGVMKYTLSPGE